jgi:hypothetical protein
MLINTPFHKYLNIAFATANEDGADSAAPDAPAEDEAPAATEAGEAKGEGEAEDSDTQASPEPEGEAKEEDKAEAQEPWYKKRIAELTYQKNEEVRQRQAYEQRIAEYERRLNPPKDQTQQQRQYTEEEVNRRAQYLAQQQAAAIAAETEFNNRCNAVFASGAQEYGQQEFKSAVETFHSAYGGMPQDFVEAALETGAAEKVIYELAKNPEKAMEVLSLPPGVKRVSAVMKLANGLAGQKPRVSGAPAPIKPQVGGSGRSDPTLEKADSIDKWMEMRNKQLAAR